VHHRPYARKGFEAPQNVIVLRDDCQVRHHRRFALNALRATDREPAQAPNRAGEFDRWLKGA
jgi:hypothetical protein